MPPKVISGGDNPYDIHDAKLSSSATAHESSSVTAHEISNNISLFALMLPTSFHLQKMDGRKLKKVEKVSEFLDYLNLITFAP